jgi:tetratricopeptide (TPR) repeat protein
VTAEVAPGLPDEVHRHLAEGDAEAAGECLRGYGERLARANPKNARRWATDLGKRRWPDPLIAGYARWTEGAIRHLTGDLTGAVIALDDAVVRLRRRGRGDLADRVSLLLIDLWGESADVAKARRVAQRLERRFMDRGDNERAAVVLANLGCAEDAVDRVDRAGRLWRRALRRLHPGTLRELLVRANLANVAAVAGRWSDAVEGHQFVMVEAERLGFDALRQQAELNLAEAEFASGALDSALERWHRIIEQASTSGSVVVALTAELELAHAEADLGDCARASQRLGRIVEHLGRAGLDREVGRALRLGAVIAAESGDRSRWRALVQELKGPEATVQRALLVADVAQLDPTVEPERVLRAATALESAGLRQRAFLARAWAARRLFDRGRTSAARTQAERVVSGRRAAPWAKLVAHHVLGRLGDADAGRHLNAAAAQADRLHGRLGAVADRAAFLALRGEVYLDLIDRLLERGRSRDRRRALDLLHRFRSGWLVDELARRADRGDDPLVVRWQALRRRLASLLASVEGDDEPRIRRSGMRVDRTLREVESELGEVEIALARRGWGIVSDRSPGRVAVDLLDRLPPRDLLVELFLDGRDLLIFNAFGGRLEARRVRGIAPELLGLVASARFHLDAHTWVSHDQGLRMTAALDSTLERIGNVVFGHIPAYDWDGLWLVPHGELYQVPWPAVRHTSGTVLADRGRLALVPGTGVLSRLLETRGRAPRWLAVSGVVDSGLPQIEYEVAELSRVWPDAHVVPVATRQDFLDTLGSADAVHLAGHALFLDGLPSASGLRLSDGWVTVHDVAATRITAQLVTFGVCSGVRLANSRDRMRSEGFLQALLAGGVRTVVGAVAPVRDEIASAFDLAFYRSMAEFADPGRAFSNGLEAVRALDPRPAAWGNFHLYGDQRPLET